MVAGPGNNYIVTGGVDFQVRIYGYVPCVRVCVYVCVSVCVCVCACVCVCL